MTTWRRSGALARAEAAVSPAVRICVVQSIEESALQLESVCEVACLTSFLIITWIYILHIHLIAILIAADVSL